VLINEEDGIIAGHGRVLAAHSLGLDEVPCIVEWN
jgi:ParB-like chromosome segregation protein Spo0J